MKDLVLKRKYWVGTLAVPILLALAFFTYDGLYPVDLNSRSVSQTVFAEDHSILRRFADENGIWRYPIKHTQVSENYLDALITYEDQYFYTHPGVNPLALIRATWQWLSNGYIVSGGSTLTMQVSRIRYPEPRTITGKLKEIVRALQLEWHFSKQDILNYYLNHAPFGGTIEGVQAASLTYFGHTAEHLTDAQAALLAVLPQAPSYYRPDRHPDRAQEARNKLMRRLVQMHKWSPEQYNDALLEQVEAYFQGLQPSAPLLSRRLLSNHTGSEIQTFINAQWQEQSARLLRNYVQGLGHNVSAAALIVENQTGKVKTYVGSADFFDPNRFAYVDMVKAIRSPGSTLKPFIYGLALDEGLIHSESLLMDVPLRFGEYQPENFNGGFIGPVSVKEALQKSLNVPAVQVLEQLMPIYFFQKLKQASVHLTLPNNSRPNLSVALGGVGSKLEDLITLYTSLGNQGSIVLPRYSENDALVTKPLLSEGAAWIIRKILLENPTTIPGLAVKTGTSYGFRDAWAIGVSQHYTLGVWVGRPDGTPMPGHYGQITAVPLLRQVFQQLGDIRPPPEQPNSVIQETICWPRGDDSRSQCEQEHMAYILDNTVPLTWYNTRQRKVPFDQSQLSIWQTNDSNLRASSSCGLTVHRRLISLWPAPLEPWLEREKRRDARIPNWDPRCSAAQLSFSQSNLRIVGLDDQDAFQLIDKTTKDLSVSAQGGTLPFYWYLNGKLIDDEQRRIDLKNLSEGKYQITLSDQSGASDSVHFTLIKRHDR